MTMTTKEEDYRRLCFPLSPSWGVFLCGGAFVEACAVSLCVRCVFIDDKHAVHVRFFLLTGA